MKNKKNWGIIFLLLAAASPLYAMGQFNARKPAVVDQDLVIRTADISHYALFYPVTIDGFKMEVIAVKAPGENIIRTTFNACIVCYGLGKGYFVQKRSVLICQQCGDQYTIDSIDTGIDDCYPIPISAENKTETASAITISREYLKQARVMFERMKEESPW
jgi:uncharacterized membrane protein